MKVISVIHDEFKTIAGSYAILLVLMGGIFVYGLLYNYMYAPDLVRKVPVAVVDHSHSELSRHYVRLLDATPQVNVVTTATGYPEASAASMLALNDDYRPEMLVFLPKEATTKLASAQAVEVVGTALYNPTEGYGTYLIPSVLVVIIFQTLMMVIAMISGDERYSGLIVRFAGNPVNLSLERMAQVVIGKTFVYGMLYAVFALFLLGLIPLMFGLPDIGNPLYVIMLMIPFLLATSFFGLTASLFFTDSDAPLLMIAFFSVGLIFLSGVSYPMELMPWYWKLVHYLIPAAPATMAYVKLNSMGASMSEIHPEYITLWVQCAFYFVTACLVYRYNIRKAMAKSASLAITDDFSSHKS